MTSLAAVHSIGLARAAKAGRLARVLREHGHQIGCTPAAVALAARLLPELGRSMVAELAGVKAPSPETWSVVCAILRADAEHAQ